MKKTLYSTFILIPFVLGYITSCNPQESGIFFSLENEQQQRSDGTLDRSISVAAMAELDNRFFIAAGTSAYWRAINSSTWNSFSIDGQDYVHDLSLASSTLWAITSSSKGNSPSLYQTTDGQAWSKVIPNENPFSLVSIIDGNGRLMTDKCILVTYSASAGYSAYLIESSVKSTKIPLTNQTFGSITTPSSLSSPIATAAFDGTSHYLQNRSYVWKTSNNNADSVSLIITTAGKDFGAMIHLNNPSYLNGNSGLYITTLANSAFDSSSTVRYYKTNETIPTKQVDISLLNKYVNGISLFSDSNALLIGSGNNVGYGEFKEDMNYSSPSNRVSTDRDHYYSTPLPNAAIHFFYQSTLENKLFLSAPGYGLWSRDPISLKWNQE